MMVGRKTLFTLVLACVGAASVTVNAAETSKQGLIYFASDRDGDLEIFSMNPDGSAQAQLTWNKTVDTNPSVGLNAPNKVAFQSNRDGNNEIYTMDSNGKSQKPVMPNKASDVYPALSPNGKKIAFASNRDDGFGYDIYTVNSDGSGKAKRLTFHKANDTRPVWSAKGDKIVFVSNHKEFSKAGNQKAIGHIWVMDADGKKQKQITWSSSREDTDPVFSPKGNTIAFAGRKITQPNDSGPGKATRDNQKTPNPGTYDIFTATAEGGAITKRTFDDGDDSDPTFSSDGEKIAFVSDRDKGMGNEVYTMTKKGEDQKPVTLNSASDVAPSWGRDVFPITSQDPPAWAKEEKIPVSPGMYTEEKIWDAPTVPGGGGGGRTPTLLCGQSFKGKIAYDSQFNHGSGSDPEIYCMNPDGSGQTQLTFNESWDFDPSKSPDGDQAVFTSDRDGNQNIYLMSADGIGQTPLTLDKADDNYPAWSPDGKKVAFSTERDGNAEIYVINADGIGGLQRLTINPGNDTAPTWSPDSKKIAFIRDGKLKVIDSVDGGNEKNIGVAGLYSYDTSWSPDGKMIAFTATHSDSYIFFQHLHLIKVDGSGLVDLTSGTGALDRAPDWSPDGSQLIYDRFTGTVGPNALFQLTTIPAAGGGLTVLTSPPTWNHNPDW